MALFCASAERCPAGEIPAAALGRHRRCSEITLASRKNAGTKKESTLSLKLLFRVEGLDRHRGSPGIDAGLLRRARGRGGALARTVALRSDLEVPRVARSDRGGAPARVISSSGDVVATPRSGAGAAATARIHALDRHGHWGGRLLGSMDGVWELEWEYVLHSDEWRAPPLLRRRLRLGSLAGSLGTRVRRQARRRRGVHGCDISAARYAEMWWPLPVGGWQTLTAEAGEVATFPPEEDDAPRAAAVAASSAGLLEAKRRSLAEPAALALACVAVLPTGASLAASCRRLEPTSPRLTSSCSWTSAGAGIRSRRGRSGSPYAVVHGPLRGRGGPGASIALFGCWGA